MVYSDEHRFVYLSPPKTGSTSVTEVLVKRFGGKFHGDRHGSVVPKKMRDYFTFATIRNPYHRAISGYQHITKKLKSLPLSDCWGRFHLISMTEFFNNTFEINGDVSVAHWTKQFKVDKRPPRVDVFVRMETLEEDFCRLPFVKIPITMPRLNVSSWHSLPLSLLRKICWSVALQYKADFQVYGYSMEISDVLGTATNGRLPIFC